MYLLNVLAVFGLSYAQNFLSLRHGSTFAFLITVLFYALSIIITLCGNQQKRRFEHFADAAAR